MATQWTAGLTSGSILPAATLNTIGAAWVSYTPVIKGGATTVTATILYARYAQINKNIFVEVAATVTSAGALNGIVSISLPSGLTPVTTGDFRAIGTFLIKDSGTAYYSGVATGTGTTVVGLGYASVDNMGASQPIMTLANGDGVAMAVSYEIA